MTHRLSCAEALALLMRHADYQRPGADRAERIGDAIPGEVLEQCRRASAPCPVLSGSGEPLVGADGDLLRAGYSEKV